LVNGGIANDLPRNLTQQLKRSMVQDIATHLPMDYRLTALFNDQPTSKLAMGN